MRDEERIAEILGRWRQRREHGHAGDPEQLIRDHPEFAAELAEHLAAERLLDAMPGAAPARIGDFEILRELGRGGMGIVYEAEQLSMRRKVALKVLPVTITGTPQAVKRFQREAHAAGKLHHTNIVPIHAMGQHAGHWYYAMELVDGRPLSEVIAQLRRAANPTEQDLARVAQGSKPASSSRVDELDTDTGDRSYFRRVAETVASVADGLQLAHVEGVVHRDIKPSNLLLDGDGTLKIVDFGLARVDDAGGPAMTMTGDLLGTPIYMSPEQVMAKRKPVDHRTDVYSLGATLYELITLQPPFRGGSIHEVCTRILTREPVPPRRRNPKVPRDLETIILKAMEKDRARRYQSADELARDLRRFADGDVIRARRVSLAERSWRRVKRYKVVSALIAAVVVASAVGGFFAWSASSEADRGRGLEYALLCAKAQEALPGARRRFFAAASPENRARYQRALELYTEAIALRPDLPEAYLWRALAPQVTLEQRLEDLDRAHARGLSKGTYHLARAYCLRMGGEVRAADAEEQLVSGDEPRTPLDRFFMATLREREAPDEALALLTRAIEESHTASAVGVQARWRRAQLAAKRKDYVGALQDLEVLRALGDDRPAVRVRIASLWHRFGDDAAAETAFEPVMDDLRASGSVDEWIAVSKRCKVDKEPAWRERVQMEALKRFPDSAKLLFERAKTLESKIAREQAVELYRGVIAADSTHYYAHEKLGILLANSNRPGEALDAFDAAALLRPDDARARVNLGIALRTLGRIDDALDAYKKAESLDSANANVHINRGALFADELNELDDALAEFDRALELGSNNASLYFNKGVVLMRQAKAAPSGSALAREKFEASAAAYTLCTERNKRHWGAYWNLGHVLGKLGRNDRALEAFDATLRLKKNHSEVHHGRVHVLIALEKYDVAIGAVNRTIQLDQQSPHLRYDKGCILEGLNQREEALQAFAEALSIDEKFTDAYEARARLFLGRSEFAKAFDAFESAIAHGNSEPHFVNEVAWLMISIPDAGHQRPARAVELARKAVHAAPKHHQFHNTIGVALFRTGDWRKALDALEKSMRLSSGGNAFDWFFVAMAKHELKTEGARAWYEKAIAWMDKHAPQDPELQRFRAEAAEVLGVEK